MTIRDPTYFGVIDSAFLSSSLFGLPYDLTIISFSEIGLACPDSDPICMYYERGSRSYIWKEEVWVECLTDPARIVNTCKKLLESKDDPEILKILELVNLYRNSTSPTASKDRDQPKTYCRVVSPNRVLI